MRMHYHHYEQLNVIRFTDDLISFDRDWSLRDFFDSPWAEHIWSQLFASRRGYYQLARAWANYPEEYGHYTPGVFMEADNGPAEHPAESDPCFLRKL
ncbi:hypothetical protein NPIL_646141, partial [Nephila pilipes]